MCQDKSIDFSATIIILSQFCAHYSPVMTDLLMLFIILFCIPVEQQEYYLLLTTTQWYTSVIVTSATNTMYKCVDNHSCMYLLFLPSSPCKNNGISNDFFQVGE